MPLQRIFCLPGVIERGSQGAPGDWESLLKNAEMEFEALTKSAPWRATHTSGGGGGERGTSSGRAAKGTLGAFFTVKASSSCVICNRPGGTDGVCGRHDCVQKTPAVRAELESIIRGAQRAQRACVAEWQQCTGCDPKRWSIPSSGARPQSCSSASPLATHERARLLAGCENEYVDVPFRMAVAIQSEHRASQRLRRLGAEIAGM